MDNWELPGLALCARDSVMVCSGNDGGAAGLHGLLNKLLFQLMLQSHLAGELGTTRPRSLCPRQYDGIQ